jgi:hypothetical protein
MTSALAGTFIILSVGILMAHAMDDVPLGVLISGRCCSSPAGVVGWKPISKTIRRF